MRRHVDRTHAPADDVHLATSRLAALHAYLRHAATTGTDDAVPVALRPAVRGYRMIDASLPSSIRLTSGELRRETGSQDRCVRARYWRALEATIFAATTIDDLRQRAARTATLIAGALCARSTLARLADVAMLAWEAYGRTVWPCASADLSARMAWWNDAVAPHAPAMLAALRRTLGVRESTPVPRVLVVPRAVEDGDVASRMPPSTPIVVAFARHDAADGVALVFHEIARALSVAAPPGSTLATLRRTLLAASVPPDVVEQTVQATIAALAAEVTRERFEGASGRGMGRYHDAVAEPLRALRTGRGDAAGFARAVEARLVER